MNDSHLSKLRDEFLSALLEWRGREGVERLLSHHMFERTPAVFEESRSAWIDWKTKLAAGLEVDPLSILLVGGAALGFSPIQDLHFFGPRSDVDVAVISPRHFDIAWHRLRSFKSFPAKSRRTLEEHRRKYVYWGAIATDLELDCFEFGACWEARLREMAEDPFTFGREINARIYRDPASLRRYQLVGIMQTQKVLLRSQKK